MKNAGITKEFMQDLFARILGHARVAEERIEHEILSAVAVQNGDNNKEVLTAIMSLVLAHVEEMQTKLIQTESSLLEKEVEVVEKKPYQTWEDMLEKVEKHKNKDNKGEFYITIHHKSPSNIMTEMRYPDGEYSCGGSHYNLYYAVWDVLDKLEQSIGEKVGEPILDLLDIIKDMQSEVEGLNRIREPNIMSPEQAAFANQIIRKLQNVTNNSGQGDK